MKELLPEQFNSVIANKNKITVIDFCGDYCPACNMMDKVFNKIKSRHSKKFNFYKANIDKHKIFASSLEITMIPTIMFFIDSSFIPLNSTKKISSKASNRITGYRDESYMDSLLTNIYNFCIKNNLIKQRKKRRRNYWQRYYNKYHRR